MTSRITNLLLIAVLAFSILVISTNAQEVWTGEAIVIKEDGTVYPQNAPISKNGMTYTLTGDVKVSKFGIIVQLDAINIDGAGHLIEGPGLSTIELLDFEDIITDVESTGIYMSLKQNITIENLTIAHFYDDIQLISSSYNVISNNIIDRCNKYGIYLKSASNHNKIINNYFMEEMTITESTDNKILNNNFDGNYSSLSLYSSPNNQISGNKFENMPNHGAIFLSSSETTNNVISNNTMLECYRGIYFWHYPNENEIFNNTIKNCVYVFSFNEISSHVNRFYYNNLIDNSNILQGNLTANSQQFDDGAGIGNYFSDYGGIDANDDGIGDSPYMITTVTIDNYPLMEPYNGAVIPEFSSWFIILLFLVATIFALSVRRRIKQN